MVDDLRSDGGLGNAPDGVRRREKATQEHRPLTDREVPIKQDLGNETRVLAPAIHAWLDGELPEASVRRGETSKDVEFWRMIGAEAERRRSASRMPLDLESRIMEALPHTLPVEITPWFRREFVVTPGKAVAIGASLVVASAAATALMIL
jgi:hypothetical protein